MSWSRPYHKRGKFTDKSEAKFATDTFLPYNDLAFYENIREKKEK